MCQCSLEAVLYPGLHAYQWSCACVSVLTYTCMYVNVHASIVNIVIVVDFMGASLSVIHALCLVTNQGLDVVTNKGLMWSQTKGWQGMANELQGMAPAIPHHPLNEYCTCTCVYVWMYMYTHVHVYVCMNVHVRTYHTTVHHTCFWLISGTTENGLHHSHETKVQRTSS